MNKRGQRERTGEGLINNMIRAKDQKSKQLRCRLNMDANYIRCTWVEFMSKDYFKVIVAGSRRVLATAVDNWSGKPYCVSS